MNSHDVAVAVYLAFVLLGMAFQAIALSGRSRIPPLGALFGRIMRTRSGRVGMTAGWVWLGLHFFAR